MRCAHPDEATWLLMEDEQMTGPARRGLLGAGVAV